MHQSAQRGTDRVAQLRENPHRHCRCDVHLTQKTHQIQSPLFAACRRSSNAKTHAPPAPQTRRHQKLRPPAPQTPPFALVTASSETDADRARRLTQNQIPPKRFDDDGGRIPPPWMQPIRQPAHRVAAIPAHVSPHPNQNPSLTQSADLTVVAAMPLHPHPSASACQLPALRTESRSKFFNGWCSSAVRAELFDRSRKAV